MTSLNIGVCFGPSLLRSENIDFDSVGTQCEIVQEIVENYDYFFVSFLFVSISSVLSFEML